LWADETIVYVDEAGMDNREDYGFGWNLRGQRFHALKSGRRQGRVNMIAALFDTPQPKGVGILASSVLSRIIANPLKGYVHKRTRTARPHLK
jgi:hypothetical protein